MLLPNFYRKFQNVSSEDINRINHPSLPELKSLYSINPLHPNNAIHTRKEGRKSRTKRTTGPIHKSLELNACIVRDRAAEHWNGGNSPRSGSFRSAARVTRISAMNLSGGPAKQTRNRCTGSDSMRLVNATLNHDRRHGQ